MDYRMDWCCCCQLSPCISMAVLASHFFASSLEWMCAVCVCVLVVAYVLCVLYACCTYYGFKRLSTFRSYYVPAFINCYGNHHWFHYEYICENLKFLHFFMIVYCMCSANCAIASALQYIFIFDFILLFSWNFQLHHFVIYHAFSIQYSAFTIHHSLM